MSQQIPAINKTIILVIGAYSYRAPAFLEAAQKLGVDVVLAVGGQSQGPLSADIRIDFSDVTGAIDALVSYGRLHDVSAILAVDDAGGTIATQAAQQLGFAHNPCDAIAAAGNKHEMRRRFAAAGVPSPGFSHHLIDENPSMIASQLQFPVVLKPLYLSGSRGVIRANNTDDFLVAFDRLNRLLQSPGTGPAPKSILVEDYMPGFEIELEGILVDGLLHPLAILDKPDPLEGPFFEETILTTPSRLPSHIQTRIQACGQQAAAALGLRTGPVHAEMRIHKGEPRMLEIAARSIGGNCSKAILFDQETSLEEVILGHAVGAPIGQRGCHSGGRGVMMIPIPRSGYLVNVHGVADALAVSGILDVEITIPLGSEVVPLPEGAQYLGFIFARGATPLEAEEALRKAHAQLDFDIRDQPTERVRIKVL